MQSEMTVKLLRTFLILRLADIAMGSGHFLVAALDRIEIALENYRNKRSLPECYI